MPTVDDDLAAYAAQLKEDLNSEKPRAYAPVVWAYQDQRVRDALSSRLSAGEVLTSSSQIVPDRALRRERVYFAFSVRDRLDATTPGILVQIDDDNSVAEILDPFDLDSDKAVPLATVATDTLPLAASSLSAPNDLSVDRDAVAELASRWASFVQQSTLARTFGAGGWGGIFGGSGGMLGDTSGSVSGGTPTLSAVISGRGAKEDPDQDTTGGHFDDLM